MNKIGYNLAKCYKKLNRNKHEVISTYYRKQGVKVGANCIICSFMELSEPYLVEIKDDVVISSEVSIVTHDHSINKVIKDKSNLFGKVVIGNNCFVGQRSVLLYGVELADNIIVAAGSVVTKSFKESNIIIGGNPAKKIGTWKEFAEKYIDKAVNRSELVRIKSNMSDKLVER